jgi:7-carboxy-7-deazaguanine synthase
MLPAQVTMNSASANLVEIFSSIQGEGLLAGVRQIFLRFQGCILRCAYCDTYATQGNEAPEFCRIETDPGSGEFCLVKNPVSMQVVQKTLSNWTENFPKVHHSLSLTGGEPLVHAENLQKWLPVLDGILPVYLETNGILVDELKQCINYLDYISMDFKLSSTTGSHCMWEKHQAFLEIAATKFVFVKVVISDITTVEEIQTACEIILSVDNNITLILQPLSSPDGNTEITVSNLLRLQEIASSLIPNVRVIPQMHKFLHVL